MNINMKTGDKITGDIVKDGSIILQNKTVEIFDGGEYQALANDGLWFQITLKEPIDLERGESCQIVIGDKTYEIEVSQNINTGSLTFVSFAIL